MMGFQKYEARPLGPAGDRGRRAAAAGPLGKGGRHQPPIDVGGGGGWGRRVGWGWGGPVKRPVYISSAARRGPINLGNSHEMPRSPALMPIRTIAALSRAVGDASRMQATSARAKPPPAAAPLT